MPAPRIALACLACLVLSLLAASAPPAEALTADEVLKLRQAGVGDETIRALIESELAQPGTSPRREMDGGRGVLYQAGSVEAGAAPTPAPEQVHGFGLEVIPGHAPGQDLVIKGERPEVSQALPLSQGRTVTVPRSYILLLESHRTLAPAERRARELNAQGIESKVESVDLGEKGRWYRVVHGGFADREAAQAKGEELKRVGGVDHFTVLNP